MIPYIVLHRADQTNAGDMSTNPLQYTGLPYVVLDIDLDPNTLYNKLKHAPAIIIGGGGLLDYCEKWNLNITNTLNYATQHSIPIYGWALGYNRHNGDTQARQPIPTKLFTRFTDRNPLSPSFLPCPSCLSHELNASTHINKGPGIIEHISTPINLPYPKINNKQSKEQIIRFIDTHSHIITNTYHAAYWAVLKEKPLIIYHPFSQRHTAIPGNFTVITQETTWRYQIQEAKPQEKNWLHKTRTLTLKMMEAL